MKEKSSVGLKFAIPKQDLTKLSFCEASPESVKAWTESLPKANLGEMSRRLYLGIQELNKLSVTTRPRMALLEAIRPAVYYVCNALKKHYLNQPLILPEKASKTVNLAQALQLHLAIGYKIIITQQANNMKDPGSRHLVSQSIHRVICELTATMFRSYQLYFSEQPSLWLELNKLYWFSEQQVLIKEEFEDSESMTGLKSSIRDVYLRACILSTIKANQLRQSEIGLIYQISAFLAKDIELTHNGGKGQSFVVCIDSDQGPIYRALIKKGANPGNRYFDCAMVAEKLRQLKQEVGSRKDRVIARQFSSELIDHLDQVWNERTQRAFNRTEQQGKVYIGVGMSTAHYYIAGGVEFEATLNGNGEFLRKSRDAYEARIPKKLNPYESRAAHQPINAFDQPPSLLEKGVDLNELANTVMLSTSDKYEVLECQLLNSSPGGYCVNLPEKIPPSVKTGEILVVKEGQGARWSVGVIRWAKRHSKKDIQVGIELLASKAFPVGVKRIQKKGDMGGYLRGLLLPGLKALEQPMTILLPNLAFDEGSKIFLNQNGNEVKASLLHQLAQTASFKQFELKSMGGTQSLGRLLEDDDVVGDDDFDAIWTTL